MRKAQLVDSFSDHLDVAFPKGKKNERGKALVLIANVVNDLERQGLFYSDLSKQRPWNR